MPLKKTFLFFTLTALLSACIYEPEKTFFSNISQPGTEGITVELDGVSENTLYIFSDTTINFTPVLKGRSPDNLRFELNGGMVYQSNSAINRKHFELRIDNLKDAENNLKMILVLKPDTITLADKNGVETTITREWKVIVNKDKPTSVSFTTFEVADGLLKLNWNKYPTYNFQKYEIRRYLDINGTLSFLWKKEITDVDVTSLSDSSFIGGKSRYSIFAFCNNQYSDESFKEYDHPYDPNVKAEWIDKTNVKFSWTKPDFYNAFTRYQVEVGHLGSSEVFQFNDINQTTLTVQPNVKFPDLVYATVYTQTRDMQLYGNGVVFVGNNFQSHILGTLQYSPALNKYFAYITGSNFITYLIRINAATFEEEDRVQIRFSDESFAITPNGEALFIRSEQEMLKLDPMTFDRLGSFDMTPFGDSYQPWKYKVSNNMMVLSRVSATFVVDLTTFAMTDQLPKDTRANISPSGKYIACDGKIYTLTAGHYVETSAFDIGTGAYPYYYFASDDRLLVAFTGTLLVVDPTTGNTQRSILIEASLYNLDPATDLVGGFRIDSDHGDPTFFVYDLDHDESIARYPIGPYQMYLLNNNLVNNNQIISRDYLEE